MSSSEISRVSLYPRIVLQPNARACCLISSLTAIHHESISPCVVLEERSLTDLELTRDTYRNVDGSALLQVKNEIFFPPTNSSWDGECIIKFPDPGTILPIRGLVSGFSSIFGLLSFWDGNSSIKEGSSISDFLLRKTIVPYPLMLTFFVFLLSYFTSWLYPITAFPPLPILLDKVYY